MKRYELCSFKLDGSSAVPNAILFNKQLQAKYPTAKIETVHEGWTKYGVRVKVLTPGKDAEDLEIVKFVKGVASHMTLSRILPLTPSSV